MNHLSPAELVDLAEGALAPSRAAHAGACARCRNAAAALGATLERTTEARQAVPDPSPLYWERMAARVREGIEDVRPAPAWTAWWSARGFTQVAAAAIMVAVVAVGVALRRGADAPPLPAVALAPGTTMDRSVEPSADAGSNEVWEVLTAAADDLRWEDVHAEGMALTPAAVDRAVMRLSPAELDELGRLLQTELKRASN